MQIDAKFLRHCIVIHGMVSISLFLEYLLDDTTVATIQQDVCGSTSKH